MRRLAVMFLAFVAAECFAQEEIYVGLGYGSFGYKESTSDPLIGNIDDTAAAYKLYGGFEMNEHFALEVSYGKSSDIVQRNSGNDPAFGDFTSVFELEFTTTAFKALGELPRDWGILLGGLGFFSSDRDELLRANAQCCGDGAQSFSFSDDGMMAMLGIEWRFGRFSTGYDVRIEYEWWDFDEGDGSTVGVGFSYRF